MQANTTSATKKIPQFDYAALAGTQPLPPDAPCSCGGAHHHAAPARQPVASAAPNNQPQATRRPSSEKSLLQTFSWYHGDRTSDQRTIEKAHDIASGIAEILSMLEQDDIAYDSDEERPLAPIRRGNLMRMAITSAQMLTEHCSSAIEYANECGSKK